MEQNIESVLRKKNQGRGVRHVRQTLDISPQYIAEKLGKSVKQYYNIEKMEQIQESTLRSISAILGVPFEFLENYDHEDTVNNFYNNSNAQMHDNATENNINDVENMYSYDNDPNFLAMHERMIKDLQDRMDALVRENARLTVLLENN